MVSCNAAYKAVLREGPSDATAPRQVDDISLCLPAAHTDDGMDHAPSRYQAQCSLLWVVLMVSGVGSAFSSSKQLQDEAYEDLKGISFHIKNWHTEVSLYTCNNI